MKNVQQTTTKIRSEQEHQRGAEKAGSGPWRCCQQGQEHLTTLCWPKPAAWGLQTSRNQQGATAKLRVRWDKILHSPGACISSVFWAVTPAGDEAKHKQLPEQIRG